MTGPIDQAEERARCEASDWFARLRGEPSDAERAQYERWRASDPAHGDAYDRIAAQWEQVTFLEDAPSVRGRNLDLARDGGWQLCTSPKLLVGLAIAAVLALALALTVVSDNGRIWSTSQSTIHNEQTVDRTVTFADGSTALLSPGSSIEARFDADSRRLVLSHGSARFTVAHDRARPFTVTAGGGTIVALGTVFEVSIVESSVRVRLIEGSIEIREPTGSAPMAGSRFILNAGEAASFVADSQEEGTADETGRPDISRGVQYDMVTFHRTRLHDAVASFASSEGTNIRVRSEVADLMITGAFRRDDPEAFATTIAAMFDLNVTLQDGVWILSAK